MCVTTESRLIQWSYSEKMECKVNVNRLSECSSGVNMVKSFGGGVWLPWFLSRCMFNYRALQQCNHTTASTHRHCMVGSQWLWHVETSHWLLEISVPESVQALMTHGIHSLTHMHLVFSDQDLPWEWNFFAVPEGVFQCLQDRGSESECPPSS